MEIQKLKNTLTVQQYEENMGFKLKNVFEIYRGPTNIRWGSKLYKGDSEKFAFPNKTLENLFKVPASSENVAYVVVAAKDGHVNCYLINSDDDYQYLVENTSIWYVYQMYKVTPLTETDNIALNTDPSLLEESPIA